MKPVWSVIFGPMRGFFGTTLNADKNASLALSGRVATILRSGTAQI